jgi:AAA family ATP:ADP antiporter
MHAGRDPRNSLVPPISRALDVRPGEGRAVAWSCGHFFFLLAGYFMIRPIRDAMGLTGGIRELPWLFVVTTLTVLLANPIYSALVSRFPRRVFVPTIYLFSISNLLLFFVLFHLRRNGEDLALARTFFVWLSVFNLFIVSVFWATMADLFDAERGKRLFGLIGVGGTLGAIVGTSATAVLATRVGEINLFPISAAFLAVACMCAMRINRLPRPTLPDLTEQPDQRIGGGVLAGITHLLRSPYLLGIFAFIGFHTFCGTFAYFAQATLVTDATRDRNTQAALFALIDLVTNVVTALLQIFLTGRIIRSLGVGWTLALLPLTVIAGFTWFGMMPTLAVLVVFQTVRRGCNFALARPARESLFTVVSREDKYKAKNFIDTFAFRGGDVCGALSFAFLTGPLLGLGMQSAYLIAVFALLVWFPIALYLGREQSRRHFP